MTYKIEISCLQDNDAPQMAADPIYTGEFPVFVVYGTRIEGFSAVWVLDREQLDALIDGKTPWMRGSVFVREMRKAIIVREALDGVTARGRNDDEFYCMVLSYWKLRRAYGRYGHSCKCVGLIPEARHVHPVETIRVAMFAGVEDAYCRLSPGWPVSRDSMRGIYYVRVAPCSLREQRRIRAAYFALAAQHDAAINYNDNASAYMGLDADMAQVPEHVDDI